MTARTWPFREGTPESADVLPGWSAKLVAGALGSGLLAAVLLAAGAVVPVVETATPGYASAPLLIALAVLPILVAGALAFTGRPTIAAGVLAGVAALTPGRLLLDLQFVADSSLSARPELYRPASLMWPGVAGGFWLLLAGHVATLVAGVLAARAVGRSGEPAGLAEPGADGAAQRRLLRTVVVGLVAGVGLVMAPFSSTDAFLPAGNAFEQPPLVLAGCLLLACALPLAGALAVSSGSEDTARGCLWGLALAVTAVALPNLVSGLAVTSAGVTAGPGVALAGALVLAGLAVPRSGSAPSEPREGDAAEANLPGLRRLRVATGVLGLLTAVLAIVGALAAQVVVASGAAGPQSPARWLLLTAGVLVGLLGLAMLVPAWAGTVRPVLSVAWVAVPVAGTAVLDTAIAATQLGGGLSSGPGVVWTSVAMFAAAVTACCSVVAGMVERDDTDDATTPRPGLPLLISLGLSGILAIGTFGTPAVGAPDYAGPGVFAHFGTPSWGLLLAMVVVLAAAALAARSRPPRAASLLAGAAVLAALRAAELPLVGAKVPGARPDAGLWFAFACVLALIVSAVLAALGSSEPAE